ncbi:hypothetical protein OAS39_12425, partial [Pirellulales bacterium]|nr:hypothetical protein [Pirellulales bacterium]
MAWPPHLGSEQFMYSKASMEESMGKHVASFGGVILFALVGHVCNANVVERDWLSPGDGLLTFDNVNRRE